MASKKTDKPKQMRGFRCMTKEARTQIAAMGGAKTRKRYGRKYMSEIGKRGRAKRARLEKKARKAAALNVENRISTKPTAVI